MGMLATPAPRFDARRPLPGDLGQRADRFAALLADVPRVAVAFSGGVDSSLVLALSTRAKGPDHVLAVLGVSPSLAAAEREQAHEVAQLVGVRLVEVETREIDDARYVVNDAERCYFCKHELYSRAMMDAVVAEGADVLVNGDTADDVLRTDRAGKRAADELDVRAPLAEAGIHKAQVREIARLLGLPVWDKPSAPCLASRIPQAMPVTIGRLRTVESAEQSLRRLGLRELRVRHRGTLGLVQLSPEDHARLRAPGAVEAVEVALQAAGFEEVEIDSKPLRRD